MTGGSTTETLWHLALTEEWEAARRSGDYRVSTRGMSLEQVGFIHTSFRHQLDGVAARFYADLTQPLLALEIDPARLTAPLRVEPSNGPGSEEFPHIYGPLPTAAVLRAIPARMVDGELVLDRDA